MNNDASNSDPWDSSGKKSFKILIEPLQGCVFEVTVRPEDSILALKMKIEELKGIPVKQQQLLLNLKELDNTATLEELSIMDQTTLQLVLALRSGPVSTLRKIIPSMSSNFLKDLIIHNRKEIGSLEPGTRLSIMVFREGTKVKMFKMVEKIDSSVGTDPLLGLSSRSNSVKPIQQLILKGQRSKHHEDPKIVQKVKLIKAKLLEQKNARRKAVDPNENYSPIMNQILNENLTPAKKKLPPLSSTLLVNEESSPRRKVEFSQVPVLPNIGPNMLPSHHASVSQGSVPSIRINDKSTLSGKKNCDSMEPNEPKETNSIAPKRRNSSVTQDTLALTRNEGSKLKPPIVVARKLDKKLISSPNQDPCRKLLFSEERKNPSPGELEESGFLSSRNPVSNIEIDDFVPAKKHLPAASAEIPNLESPFNDDFAHPKKKSKNRCSECRKKLTISNMYECRCGLLLCSTHRYSEAHNCSFDYKTEGRKLIKKVNPLVIAPKLPKI